MASVIILGLGLLLLFLEFFLPGGILGAIGGVLIITSVFTFAVGDHGALLTLGFTGLAILSTILTVRYSLNRIRTSENGLYSRSDQEGYVASEVDREIFGKTGEVLTDLKPSGYIVVEGSRYQAISQSGYMIKGTQITVVGGQGAHLTVRPLKPSKS